MRKYQYNQVGALIQTLFEADEELRDLLAKDADRETINALLASCQNFAIRIGEYIEELKGEGTKTVALLEEYCELAYQLGMEPSQAMRQALRKQLAAVEKCAEAELRPNRIEVVFLPYKASMWDSLESIWLAAKADPQCDAYVVPIPYFDRKPDGTAGTMHYEGGLYPAGVPITDWRDYDIENRHPDAIFIHNPYDEYNYVTTVMPPYYSKRLKGYTDLLCYVPYFVVGAVLPEHFYTLPAVEFADRVIVQTEQERKTYMQAIKAFEKAQNCKGRFGKLEEKIVALGSPKLDKVAGYKPKADTLPEAWQPLVLQQGNREKTLVLYNTSVDAFLKYSDRYIKKIQDTLQIFQSREELLLWWRPHPLLEATIKSLRPELHQAYRETVEEYRRGSWGIYDDTSDLHRAIGMSDALISDRSSVVTLYAAAHKPTLVQNIDVVSDEPPAIWFEALCEYDGHYWVSEYAFNGIFKINKQTWAAEYVGEIPNEQYRARLYNSVALCGSKAYFSPCAANEIAVLDAAVGTIDKIPIELPARHTKIYRPDTADACHQTKYCKAICYKQYVFFVGQSLPNIARLDTVSGEICYFDDWAAEAEKGAKASDLDAGMYFFDAVCVDNLIVAPCCLGNKVLVFNMDDGNATFHKVGESGWRFYGVCHDGAFFWFLPYTAGTPAGRWCMADGAYTAIDLAVDKPTAYSFIRYVDGCVWLMPLLDVKAYKINTSTLELSVAEEFQKACEAPHALEDTRGKHGFNYILAQVVNGKLCALLHKSGVFAVYSPREGQYASSKVAVGGHDGHDLNAALRQMFMNMAAPAKGTGHVFVEDDCHRIPGFLDFVGLDENKAPQKARAGDSPDGSGKRIYDYIKEVLSFGEGAERKAHQ